MTDDVTRLNDLKRAIGDEADRLGIPKAGETTTSLIAKIARHIPTSGTMTDELRAQLAEAWDDGHAAGIDFAYGTYTDNPYRTQHEETP